VKEALPSPEKEETSGAEEPLKPEEKGEESGHGPEKGDEEALWQALIKKIPNPDHMNDYPYAACFRESAEENGLSTALVLGIARKLCEHLNETETVYPGTNMRMIYELVSD